MILPHSVIRWGSSLLVGIPFVDHDHHEAVEMINRMAGADGAERLSLMRAFLGHCEEHFAREEEMMTRTGFFALDPHRQEHQRVLAEAQRVLTRLEMGSDETEYFREVLPQWFLEHRATMDYVTADFALEHGWHGEDQDPVKAAQ
ncbi:conserved hypothetical protein [Candidatus Terasakiella magnetica]|nr:conserved hypothetical protein [Candidatus Terasakiella magnetica]